MSAGESKPRIPKGQPLNLTDDELDALAEVTPLDVEQAADWFRTRAVEGGQRRYARLLDAVEDEGDE